MRLYLMKVMKSTKLFIFSGIAFLSGISLFAFYQGWIIIRYPYPRFSAGNFVKTVKTEKKIVLSFWHNKKWYEEESLLIWTDEVSENVRYVLNNLLSLMHEEEALSKKLLVELVMITPSQREVFISFDRCPFESGLSTFKKWMFIESLLKTIRINKIGSLQEVRFLVNHKLLEDYHLDFSQSWPITGFIKENYSYQL